MPYLLYSRRTATTGRMLREALGIDGGTRPPQGQVDMLVRWGSSERVARRPLQLINRREAVQLACDKEAALYRMRDNNVPTPRVYGANDRIDTFPVLGRKAQHTQGKDIVLCLQRMDLDRARQAGCTHFTALIPKAREFRLHVFQGEVLKFNEKVLTDPEKYNPWLWNFETGFTFRQVRPILPAQQQLLEALAISAVQSLGLDFGAVDICLGDDGLPRVFEVNTGPSLAEKSLGVYARKLADVLGVEVNEDVIERLNNANADEDEEDAGE